MLAEATACVASFTRVSVRERRPTFCRPTFEADAKLVTRWRAAASASLMSKSSLSAVLRRHQPVVAVRSVCAVVSSNRAHADTGKQRRRFVLTAHRAGTCAVFGPDCYRINAPRPQELYRREGFSVAGTV